jgi:glycine cleavage system H protein
MVTDDRKYSQEHEWVLIEGDIGTVGVTEYAANELGDVVFVELPEVGGEVTVGEAVGTIESVKAVADLYTPVSGEVVEINEAIVDQPELVNSDPLDAGWLMKIRLVDKLELEQLMSVSWRSSPLPTTARANWSRSWVAVFMTASCRRPWTRCRAAANS